jgi:RIP metalloprotease RseP
LDQPQTPDRSDKLTPPLGTNGTQTSGPIPSGDDPAAPSAAPPPLLTPMGWLMNNGIYLLLIIVGVVWLYRETGLEGLWKAGLVILGLGFVIFIHELGHFVAAKWCDVHVTTFSIGFGPALPGCSWQRGETTYKLAILPLGGYVNMVGEGPEADESEDYPRSFKNKSVGQRMLIISAGVIMNVLLGCICFVFVYRTHGVERPPAVVWRIESGSPAWIAGVRTDSVITRIDNIDHPYFEDLRMVVALSGNKEPIKFVFQSPGGVGTPLVVDLEPRKDLNDSFPVIGVAPLSRLKLFPKEAQKYRELPVTYTSSAAFARVIDLKPGDSVVRIHGMKASILASAIAQLASAIGQAGSLQNPWQPALLAEYLVVTEMKNNPKDQPVVELCKRLSGSRSATVTLEVRRAGAASDVPPEEVELKPEGFDFGDSIIGTTDPDTPTETFRIKALPLAEDKDVPEPRGCNPFEFRKRLKQLAGKPIVVQVLRDKGQTPVNILVPPSYHWTLGVCMKMGEVAAVRNQSPAAKAGMQPAAKAGMQDANNNARGDELKKVMMSFHDQAGKQVKEPFEISIADPVRLPFELESQAREGLAKKLKVRVTVTVLRPNPINHRAAEDLTLPAMEWDESWTYQQEGPVSPSAPMSIPELGIAYRVQPTVTRVKPGSPAAQAGVKEDDEIVEMTFLKGTEKIQTFRLEDKGSEAALTLLTAIMPSFTDTFYLLDKGTLKRVVKTDGEEKLVDPDWMKMTELKSKREPKTEVYDRWPYFFWRLQADESDYRAVKVAIRRGGVVLPQTFDIVAEEDTSWPLANIGLLLMPDLRLQKADTMMEALGLGVDRTGNFIKQIYLNLRSLVNGRISTDTLGGPIEIASQTFAAAEDPYILILWLGMISVNLAVVNFLPIPVLDGGHMVFLIYEKLRGRPPSEAVRAVATYMGLAALASLMIFVFWLDIKRRMLG